MKWPWVSKRENDLVVGLLARCEVALESERRARLDTLSSLAHTDRALAVAQEQASHAAQRVVALEAKADLLMQEVLRFKEAPKRKASVDPAHAQSDEQIVRQAEDGFLTALAKDLQTLGVDSTSAMREAKRIREEVKTVTMHPGG